MSAQPSFVKPRLPEIPETPFYFYDETILRALSAGFSAAVNHDPRIVLHYAMKANSHPAVLKIIGEYGAGLDVVSGEELNAGLAQGVAAARIVYSGVGKSERELEQSVRAEIGLVIVESQAEFAELCEVARLHPEKKVRVGFRFNPNLNVETHPYIATGLWDHKFGMSGDEIVGLIALDRPANIAIEALSLHLGSQIFADKVFYDALAEITKLAAYVTQRFKVRFPILDVGGGLGVNYLKPFVPPDFATYGRFLQFALKAWDDLNPGLGCRLYSECGRALVAQAGFLVTRVLRIKQNPKKKFAIVDASMTELIRPALYQAVHHVEKVSEKVSNDILADSQFYDVVGPVCESADCLATGAQLPVLTKGDVLWVTCAGAYGFVMASTYNMRPLPAEYLLTGDGKLNKLHGLVKPWSMVTT